MSIDGAVKAAIAEIKKGNLILYPTEGVYGLGCDPGNLQAIEALLALKQRSWEKGLILVAANLDQLRPYIGALSPEDEQLLGQTWPGPVTWVLPANPLIDPLIVGNHKTLACRVSAHPVVQALCQAFGGPIISTSANVSDLPPARTQAQAKEIFPMIDVIVPGELGTLTGPTPIKILANKQILRQG